MGDWRPIFSGTSQHEALLVKGLLEAHGIISVVMDQGASPYPQVGDSQVYVRPDDVVRALYLVRKHHEA